MTEAASKQRASAPNIGQSQAVTLGSVIDLAVLGGSPIASPPLGKPWPIWGDEERQLLNDVLESGRWWQGAYGNHAESYVGKFETAFANYQDAKFAVAVTNGTAALECAYKAAGVEAGDEVIVPAITFVATATAVLQVGAVPVFVDVDPFTYTINPQAIESAITKRTRCIASVDYGGLPCDYDALALISRQRGIPVVADCAHAHGSRWKGIGVGALTDLGTFSFQHGKVLSCGEGGMVLTNDASLAEIAYSYHNVGRLVGRPSYEHHIPSSNLRMTEWQAAIGLAQLSRLDGHTLARDRNSSYLASGLASLEGQGVGVAPLTRDPRVTRWGFYMWHFRFLPERWDGMTRNQFIRALRAEGVPCSIGHTRPLYRNPLFTNADRAFGRTGFPVKNPFNDRSMDFSKVVCPEAERIFLTEAVQLPHTIFLGEQEAMVTVLAAIEKIWGQRHKAIDVMKSDASTFG